MFCDPGCPWGYSANPAISTLHWRYGDQLSWRLVMIGLTESAQQYIDRGYTPVKSAQGYASFRRYGMPFATMPKPAIAATSPACRAIVATRQLAPSHEMEVFRALQHTWFNSALTMDSVEALRAALDSVAGVDSDAVLAAVDSDAVRTAYEADRALTRTAEGRPTDAQGKAANSDGRVRYTAPSLIFTRGDTSLEAGGFQPLAAYDVCIANLNPTLDRRAAPESALDALRAFSYPLATAEIAMIMTTGNDLPHLLATEQQLIKLAGDGAVLRAPTGHDALWSIA